jgi:hypothetical protein
MTLCVEFGQFSFPSLGGLNELDKLVLKLILAIGKDPWLPSVSKLK